MKTFKAICVSSLLVLALSIPVLADTAPGDNHSPGSPAPCSTTGTSTTESGAELVDGGTAVADTSFSLFADMLWAMTSIF